jgi:hypothetical protein
MITAVSLGKVKNDRKTWHCAHTVFYALISLVITGHDDSREEVW